MGVSTVQCIATPEACYLVQLCRVSEKSTCRSFKAAERSLAAAAAAAARYVCP